MSILLRQIYDCLERDLEELKTNENYKRWLLMGTKDELKKTKAVFDEWFNKNYINNIAKSNEADNAICEYIAAIERDSFEKGAKFGAQIILDLTKTE
jgi:hypothetical protein